jgi:hypothetical protein
MCNNDDNTGSCGLERAEKGSSNCTYATRVTGTPCCKWSVSSSNRQLLSILGLRLHRKLTLAAVMTPNATTGTSCGVCASGWQHHAMQWSNWALTNCLSNVKAGHLSAATQQNTLYLLAGTLRVTVAVWCWPNTPRAQSALQSIQYRPVKRNQKHSASSRLYMIRLGPSMAPNQKSSQNFPAPLPSSEGTRKGLGKKTPYSDRFRKSGFPMVKADATH